MNKQIFTNEIMPDPNEVKPEAINEMGEKDTFRLAITGMAFVAGIVALAIIIGLL